MHHTTPACLRAFCQVRDSLSKGDTLLVFLCYKVLTYKFCVVLRYLCTTSRSKMLNLKVFHVPYSIPGTEAQKMRKITWREKF